jgi:FKBP-type peptidyl-prolyl cis-trans isomerase SlyD
MSQVVGKNRHVTFSYSIADADSNEVLEAIEVPIPYIHGGTQRMFDKVEAALDGARVGDLVEISLTPKEGFGEPDPELIFTDSVDNVPAQYRRVGAEVDFQNDHGETKSFVVTNVSEKEITIDGNNPLVGKNLIYRVKIHAVREASDAEIKNGMPTDGPPLGLH